VLRILKKTTWIKRSQRIFYTFHIHYEFIWSIILRPLNLLKISFLEGWVLFHSRNGSCVSRLECKWRGNRTQLLILGGHLKFYFNIWNMRLWKPMIVRHNELFIKQNFELWKNIGHNRWRIMTTFQERAMMFGWPC